VRGLPLGRLSFAAVALWAAVAFSAEVDASLTGLLQARPRVASGEAQSLVPFFAMVGLNARQAELGPVDDVRVGIGAWGRVSLLGNEDTGGDVDLAYVSGKLFDQRLSVTLGRQFKTGGAFRALQLDGASIDVALPGHIVLTALGGAPVIPRFALGKGDATWGGRLAWRPNWNSELGLSYLELLDKGYTGRRDLGLDGRYLIRPGLSVTGLAVFSLLENRFAEAEVTPQWRVSDMVELTASVRHTSPDLFLPRTSIFSVFADVTRTEGALGAWYTPTRRFSAGADVRFIQLEAGTGYEAWVTAGFRPKRHTRTSLTVTRLGLPSNAYTRARLAGGHAVGKLDLSLDLDAAYFDKAVNGKNVSLQAQANARLPLPGSLDLVVSGLAATDPLFQQRFEVLARVIYTFNMHSSTDEKKKASDDEEGEK